MAEHSRTTIDAEPAVPRFTAAYLRVAGGECAVIETYTSNATPRILEAIASAGMTPADVKWVVVTHAHLDHAAGASSLLRACPHATLLAHPRAAKHLIDPTKLVASATAVYGRERFAQLYGSIEPISAERVRPLDDGAVFELGGSHLRVLYTYGHANHHLIVDDPEAKTVYTGDTFGLVYPDLQGRGVFAMPSTSPTNFDAAEARKSIEKVLALGEPTACPTHFGEVSDVKEVSRQLRAWIDRAEAWLDAALRSSDAPEPMTAWLAEKWREAIVEESDARGLGFGRRELDLLALDIDLNAQGLASVAMQRRKPA